MSAELSIVICTWNRADDLQECLRALHHDLVAREDVEVLIVDNNCTDGTPERVQWFLRASERFRLTTEPRAGLARARNRGIRETTGRVIAFLDDDAVVRPGWTRAVMDAFDTECVDAVGGRIELRWPDGVRPHWLPQQYESYYTCLDLGDDECDMPGDSYPFGANMAVARRAIGEDAFAEDLGRRGASLISSEEAALFASLRKRGGRIVYEPDAVVDHIVPRSRVSRRWVLRRLLAQGTSDAILTGAGNGAGPATLRRCASDMVREARRALAWLARGAVGRRPDSWHKILYHGGRLAYLCAWSAERTREVGPIAVARRRRGPRP